MLISITIANEIAFLAGIFDITGIFGIVFGLNCYIFGILVF